jgi:hypothetical protein
MYWASEFLGDFMANQNPYMLQEGNPYSGGLQDVYESLMSKGYAQNTLDELNKNAISGSPAYYASMNNPNSPVRQSPPPQTEWQSYLQSAQEKLQKIYGNNPLGEEYGGDYSSYAPKIQMNPNYLPSLPGSQVQNQAFNPYEYAKQTFGKNSLVGGMGGGGSSAYSAPLKTAPQKPITNKSTSAYPNLATSSLNQLRQNLESSNQLDARKRDIQRYMPTSGANAKEIY